MKIVVGEVQNIQSTLQCYAKDTFESMEIQTFENSGSYTLYTVLLNMIDQNCKLTFGHPKNTWITQDMTTFTSFLNTWSLLSQTRNDI